MKNYIILPKEKDYNWPIKYTNDKMYYLIRLITDYGDSSLSIQRSLNANKGLVLGTMGYTIKENLVYIYQLYDEDSEQSQIVLPLNTFKFIIDNWRKIISLSPDFIILSEKDGKYSISAEFDAPIA